MSGYSTGVRGGVDAKAQALGVARLKELDEAAATELLQGLRAHMGGARRRAAHPPHPQRRQVGEVQVSGRVQASVHLVRSPEQGRRGRRAPDAQGRLHR